MDENTKKLNAYFTIAVENSGATDNGAVSTTKSSNVAVKNFKFIKIYEDILSAASKDGERENKDFAVEIYGYKVWFNGNESVKLKVSKRIKNLALLPGEEININPTSGYLTNHDNIVLKPKETYTIAPTMFDANFEVKITFWGFKEE
jgi:hypothetical protein